MRDCAHCEAAARTCKDWQRIRALRDCPAAPSAPSTHNQQPPGAKGRAWVTLLSDASYYPGVQALHSSLQVSDTDYPLVVMITASVAADTRAKLTALGSDTCIVREVEPLPLPCGTGGQPRYACAHFADCWLKLHMWEWESEFELLCYLDADMLVLKNMDELLERRPPPLCLRAVPECGCVSMRSQGRCFYSAAQAVASGGSGDGGSTLYFNAGLLVLTPNRALLRTMMTALETCDLSAFAYAEQDFLNLFFRHRWEALKWTYNATKGLYAKHREDVWDLAQVRNLHYTMAKPWNLRDACHAGYERLNEIWRAAFVEPKSLTRVTLRAVLQEKKARAERT
jgi:hypothetical protein